MGRKKCLETGKAMRIEAQGEGWDDDNIYCEQCGYIGSGDRTAPQWSNPANDVVVEPVGL